MDEYLDAIRDSNLFCMVSPEMPSGYMFPEEDMMCLLETAKEYGTRIVVDESFVDFAEPKMKYTLLNNSVLKKYQNLVVIRSIGKTFGVAGLRLGILGSNDLELVKEMKSKMSIWNINSFAEYYLQIYNDFFSYYKKSCEMISEERIRVSKEIEKINGLKAYPSQANYIMIGIGKINSRELAIKLMENGFLMRDLSPKDFFDKENFIRIAVKTPEENNRIIASIYSIIKQRIESNMN